MPLILTIVLTLSSLPPQRPCAGEDVALIPRGERILIDGRVEADEWRDACDAFVTSDYRMLVKRDSGYLYIAIVRSAPAIFGVNLYVTSAQPASPYLNLHASAKIGERIGRRGAWPEWHWWNHHGWSVNVARFNAFEGERFLPDTAKEFQIALSRLPGRNVLLTLDVEKPDGTTLPVTSGPTFDGMHWVALRLDR